MDREARTPPADLSRWVALREETCRFPGCRRSAAACDIDHAVEWHDGGVTDAGDLVTVCRPDHLAKSHRLWREEPAEHGRVDWTSPWGRAFSDPPPEPADPAPAGLRPHPPGDAAPAPVRSAPPDGDDCPF